MERYILPSIWNRDSRNGANNNFKFLFEFVQGYQDTLDEINDRINLANELQNIVDNSAYKVGVNFEDVVINGDNVTGTITDLRIFLRSGPASKALTEPYEFSLKRNELLYVDFNENPIQIHKGDVIAHSGVTYGSGAFYNDSKILLLTNFSGSWMGAISAHMLAQAGGTGAGLNSAQPRLMAQKVGNDYYIYEQSKYVRTRYARYKLQYQDIPYSSGNKYSNVKVHTLNEVMNVSYNGASGSMTEYQQIVQSGAWELALRESNVSDAVGGIAHGDEIETMFQILLNGVEMDDIPETLTTYETIEFRSLSNVYRDTQTYYPAQDMCTHYKSYLFDSNTRDLIMDSSIKMKQDVTVNYFFLSMLSATKTYNNKAMSNIDFEVQDLSDPTGNRAEIHDTRYGIDVIHLFGGNAPITAELLEHKTTGNTGARISDAHYNKIYFSSGLSGDTLKTGDVIRAKTRIDINIKV